jgi:C4-dicarboxylate-specific signal transduction histidine kinase
MNPAMDATLLTQYLAFAAAFGWLYLSVALFVATRADDPGGALRPLRYYAFGAGALAALSALGDAGGGAPLIHEVVPRGALALVGLLLESARRTVLPASRPARITPLLLAAPAALLPLPVALVASQVAFALGAGAAGGALLRRGPNRGGSALPAGAVGASLVLLGAAAAIRAALDPLSRLVQWTALDHAAVAVVVFGCATTMVLEPPVFVSPHIRRLVRLRSVFVGLLAAVLVLGLPYYLWRAQVARAGVEDAERQVLSSAAEAVSAGMTRSDVLVRLLASQSGVAPFLAAPGPLTRAAAELAVDRFASALPLAVAWLMDNDGGVVAASNRFLRESRVGQSFVSEAAFVDARFGSTGRQLVTRASPRARIYRSTAPVTNASGDTVGVAALEVDVENWNLVREGPTIVLLVDTDATIFFSSRPEWEGRSLWPMPSPQAGAALFSRMPTGSELSSAEGRPVLVASGPLPLPGWSVVVLEPAAELDTGLLLNLVSLLAVLLGVLSFVGLQHVWVASNSRIAFAESRYRAVIEGAPLWISLVDGDRRVAMANPAGSAAWDIPLVGTPFRSLWPGIVADRVDDALARADRGETVLLELPAQTAGGEARVWSVSLRPVGQPGGGRAILVVGEDVTGRRLAERTALVTERLASIGTLAAGVAHRFNNINMGLLGSIEALERIQTDTDARAQLLEGAKALIHEAGEVSNRLMEFAKPSSGEKRPVRLGAVVADVAALIDEAMSGEGIDLRLSLADDEPVLVNVDRIRFVAVSLVTNAREAVLGQDRRRIDVSTGIAGGKAFLRVADSGPGLPGDAAQLFNPFYTTKGEWAQPGSSAARIGGLGLSLSVCQAIVNAHGGRIEAGSAEGGGAVFTVVLPLVDGGGM